jgi:protein-S-isoprenylcysteine O-methyltransferase Ste14
MKLFVDTSACFALNSSTDRNHAAAIEFNRPAKTLVVRGLYRVVRNPMYVGVLLILIGESMGFSSLAIFQYTLVVWLMFHVFVIFYEEPALRKKFGAAYEEYRRSVSRWIPTGRFKLDPDPPGGRSS